MSVSKENLVFVFIVNLLVSVGVVTAGIALFAPKPAEQSPAGPQGAEVARLTEQVTKLRERVAEIEPLEQEVADLTMRVAASESKIRALPDAGALADAKKAPAPVPDLADTPEETKPTAEEQMAKGISAMMKAGMRNARDRFIRDLMDRSERGEQRAARRVDQAVQMIASTLKLDARDTAEVDRILTDVDAARREKFRTLLTDEPNPDDIEFDDIKTILDDSFAEEDRMISSSLSQEKAEEYKKTAEPIRSFFYGAARMAFTDLSEEK